MHEPPKTKKEEWRQSWRTPDDLFNTLHAEFGFDLDAAADHDNAKLDAYCDKDSSGLDADWRGRRVWCNPPYNDIGPWVDKAIGGGAEVAALLVPATFSTAWAQDAMTQATEVRLFTKRVSFDEPPELTAWREANGKPKSGPAGAPMLLIFEKPSGLLPVVASTVIDARRRARFVTFCDVNGAPI